MIPEIIKNVGFDFRWENQKVWALPIEQSALEISELIWHFDIPFLDWDNGRYNLRPNQIIQAPENYPAEYLRTRAADISYPIDIMQNKGRGLMLDGLHRLMKSFMLKRDVVDVRKIPRDCIGLITPD